MTREKLQRNIGDNIAAIAEWITNGEAIDAIMRDIDEYVAAARAAAREQGRIAGLKEAYDMANVMSDPYSQALCDRIVARLAEAEAGKDSAHD